MKKRNVFLGLILSSVLALGACTSTEADTVSENLSKSADSFKIQRKVVFVNTMTDKYLLSIEGRCSLDAKSDKKVAVICKTGKDKYKRHTMGLSNNVTYVVEQTDAKYEDAYHYKLEFRPQAIIPDINIKVK